MIEDDDQHLDEPAPHERRRSRPLLATVLTGLCALVLFSGLVFLFWLRGQTQEHEDAQQDRAAVVQAAQRFTVTWNTFRPKDADTYVERVTPLLSTKFAKEFADASEDVVTGITQQRLFSKGRVLTDGDDVPLVGIASIDPDSAEVLVVADATRVANRQRVLRHWRWQLSMVKVDGEWLVDHFKEV